MMSKRTKLILKKLEEAIKNKDMVFDIKGETKSGMSESVLSIAPEFNKKFKSKEAKT